MLLMKLQVQYRNFMSDFGTLVLFPIHITMAATDAICGGSLLFALAPNLNVLPSE